MDMTMNTVLISANEYISKIFKMVNTFDANGFCAFVPNPPRTSFLGQLLTPFDFYTWISFLENV